VSVTFFGGPLDGCVEPAPSESIRVFPNPEHPTTHVVVYTLISFPSLRYHFDPVATERANLKLAKERELRSKK
jgi:hypothetical protein